MFYRFDDAVHQILAITTDADFHVPGDIYSSGDEYFTLDEVIDACNAENIKVTIWQKLLLDAMFLRSVRGTYGLVVSAMLAARLLNKRKRKTSG